MKKLSRPHPSQPNFSWDEDTPARTAKLRMVELPTDESRDLKKQVLFPRDDLWVPVAVANGNVHILPGIPRLCELAPHTKVLFRRGRSADAAVVERLLDGLRPFLIDRLADPSGSGIGRILISTPLPESAVAPYLTTLAAKVEPKGVKVGSYPRFDRKRNTVTLVGRYRSEPFSLGFPGSPGPR